MQNIESYIEETNREFKEMIGGTFVKLSTGEMFTRSEVLKYVQRKMEIFNSEAMHENNMVIRDVYGIEPSQRIINNKSKTPVRSKTINKSKYLKDDKSEFNIVHRNRIKEIDDMDLTKNEKLVYYIIRNYVDHPYNNIVINGIIPTFKDLEPLVSLTERSIRESLKTLEEKNLLKLKQAGHRKSIYINPAYYATGKELSIDTLKMFGLLEIDDDKIDYYLKQE